MALQSTTQRTLLFGFIASVCGCALIGIYILAIGNLGNLEGQVLATTATIAGTFLLGLLAAVPTARRTWHPLGSVAMVSLAVPLAMTIFLIWADLSYGAWSRDLERWLAVAWTIAPTLTLLSLLSLARLKSGFEWVRIGTVIINGTMCVQIILSILMDFGGDGWYRIMGILTILTICGVISVPILHRISAIPLAERVHTAELLIQLTCPRCGLAQTLAAGGAACSGCRLRITVDIEEDQCRSCGYPLYTLNSAVCPECGTPIAREPAGAT